MDKSTMKRPACGAAVLDAKESRRVNTLMREFNQQVNVAIVDPGFIMTVRKKTRPRPTPSRADFWRWGECVFSV
jgi:Antitoxin component of bacterial toxin-antitoxin system, MqsA